MFLAKKNPPASLNCLHAISPHERSIQNLPGREAVGSTPSDIAPHNRRKSTCDQVPEEKNRMYPVGAPCRKPKDANPGRIRPRIPMARKCDGDSVRG